MNATHWQTVYTAKSDAELSRFQDSPARSLAEISALTPVPRRIVDAGGGQSALAPALLATPAFADSVITVLDISAAAIARGRERAGPLATRVRWLVDEEGPCAGPVKDSQRTKTQADTTDTLFVVWGTTALPGAAAAAARWCRDLLATHGGPNASLA